MSHYGKHSLLRQWLRLGIRQRAIERIKAQPFFHSPRRRWTPEEIAEYERGHKERTRKALERIEERMEVRREWRGVKR